MHKYIAENVTEGTSAHAAYSNFVNEAGRECNDLKFDVWIESAAARAWKTMITVGDEPPDERAPLIWRAWLRALHCKFRGDGASNEHIARYEKTISMQFPPKKLRDAMATSPFQKSPKKRRRGDDSPIGVRACAAATVTSGAELAMAAHPAPGSQHDWAAYVESTGWTTLRDDDKKLYYKHKNGTEQTAMPAVLKAQGSEHSL